MTLTLLYIFAFLRPILLLELTEASGGFGIFDIAATVFVGILVLTLLVKVSVNQRLNWSGIDSLILLYVLWCIVISLIYPEKTDFKLLVKWVAPFLTWYVAKNVLKDRAEYLKAIRILLFGLGIAIVVSAFFIGFDLERALDKEIWATKQRIYEGAFADSHYLGQAAALYVMLGLVYWVVASTDEGNKGRPSRFIYGMLFLIGLFPAGYCIVYSSVRTVIVGLVILFTIYMSANNKKLLFSGLLILTLVGIASAPSLKIMFNDFVEVAQGERSLDRIGSGRPRIWAHNLGEFSNVSIDRQIAGVGIGNKVAVDSSMSRGGDSFWPSHNDFLAVLIHTGIVGLGLFILIQIAFLRRILLLPDRDRDIFLAVLISVVVMTFSTGSYVSYFGIAQIYYLMMSYLETEENQLNMRSKKSIGRAPARVTL